MELLVKEASEYFKTKQTEGSFMPRILKYSYLPHDYKLFSEKLFYKSNIKLPLFANEANFTFRVKGKTYRIPFRLRHIVTQILEATEILNYPDNWDDEGALATNQFTFEKAVTFITDYTAYIYQQFSIVLNEFYIDILRDGSVSVHWKAENESQLFIIFKKEENALAYYYAVSGERKIPLNSAVEPAAPVDETLALWMKNHLS
jgi:hypothetical protein